MTCLLHRGAELDLAEAARFYRREGGRAVAARFLDEFERIAELLGEHPGIGTAGAREAPRDAKVVAHAPIPVV